MIGAKGALIALLAVFGLSGAEPAHGFAPPEEPALIAVSVFRDPGFALPHANVTLTTVKPPEGRKPAKPQRAKADAHGEYIFRLPAKPATYSVRAEAPGFAPQEKTIELSGGPERQDAYLTLKPESK